MRWLAVLAAGCSAAGVVPPAELVATCGRGPEGTAWRFEARVAHHATVTRIRAEIREAGALRHSFRLYPEPGDAVWRSEWRDDSLGCARPGSTATFVVWDEDSAWDLGTVPIEPQGA